MLVYQRVILLKQRTAQGTLFLDVISWSVLTTSLNKNPGFGTVTLRMEESIYIYIYVKDCLSLIRPNTSMSLISDIHQQPPISTKPGWWYTCPSEKWWSSSQLGWLFHSQLNGKSWEIPFMFQSPPSRHLYSINHPIFLAFPMEKHHNVRPPNDS